MRSPPMPRRRFSAGARHSLFSDLQSVSRHQFPAKPQNQVTTILVLVVSLVVSAPWTDALAASASEEGGGGWPVIAKIVNFAALVGLLVYFLRRHVALYFRTRSDAIRRELVDAAALRTSAEQQLAAVRARIASLPAELEALGRRGQEELAAERVRMQDATAREREQLVERTGRDIDRQFRLARRALVEHTAVRAMALARARIERQITPDDHARLIERYSAEVRP